MTPTEYIIAYLISGWSLGTVGAWFILWIGLKIKAIATQKKDKESSNE